MNKTTTLIVLIAVVVSGCVSMPISNDTKGLPIESGEGDKVGENGNTFSYCSTESDCGWVSTNCCPESGGASWECVNHNTLLLNCLGGQDGSSNVPEKGCRQFVSPKPTSSCLCISNVCQAG